MSGSAAGGEPMSRAATDNIDAPGARRLPSEGFYAVVRWTSLGLLALLILYAFVFSRYLPSPPRGVGVRLVLLAVVSINVFWWCVADRRMARFIQSDRVARIARSIVGGISCLLILPMAIMMLTGEMLPFERGPWLYGALITLWHVCLVPLLPIILGLRGLAWVGYAGGRRIKGLIAAPTPEDNTAVAPPRVDSSRRMLLRTAVASVPMAALGAGAFAALAQRRTLNVRRQNVVAPWLPDRLRGLTITHISDLHVGRLYRPDMLPELVDKANALKSDIVLITGDIVDNSNDMLPPALRALKQIESPHGTYACIGNHDEIDSRPDFVSYTRPRLPLLNNERRRLAIGGEHITIAGLDYANDEAPHGRRKGHLRNIEETMKGYASDKDGPVIALSHHPHAWDALAKENIPLTLAGHTHGGQIMFTPPGERPDVGIGRMLLRYTMGLYESGVSQLFVTSGVGNWFPVRFNAPAEIVQLRLV